MSAKPADLVATAKLLGANPPEGNQRGALSRAYYGAFHACKEWHQQLPEPGSLGSNGGRGGGVHQELIDQLRNPGRRVSVADKATSKDLSRDLFLLRARRRYADYQLGISIDPLEVQNQIDVADDVLTRT